MLKCPCCSNKLFEDCCKPVINNYSARTAQSLMRSRYSAFKTLNAEYLINTTHSDTRSLHDKKSLQSWAEENSWDKLEIMSSEFGNINDLRGTVEFKAYFTNSKGEKNIQHEKSTFIKEENKWYYLNGISNPKEVDFTKKISRNDPCSCGSGKKFKKCCG